MDKIFFMVEMGNIHHFVWARDREDAKTQAFPWIGANPDDYVVSPLTAKGDRVSIGVLVLST